ncbi:Protein tamozhennic [Halotydeus destructor]|nr:Protein tamozhennic [Halotydeus destructor]
MSLSWKDETPCVYDAVYEPSTPNTYDEIRWMTRQNHLAYLNMDDCPAKFERRVKLEELVNELLSMVPHKRKFETLEVSECLNRSIAQMDSFSAYDAGLAFETLEKLATNLLNYPWRKEYLILRCYSGLYKFKVARQLRHFEQILSYMGYRMEEDHTLRFTEIPADPGKLTKVAFDCLLAYVECQTMLKISERVNINCIEASFQEIHAVRRKFICDVDSATQIITEAKEEMYNQSKNIANQNGSVQNSRHSRNSLYRANGQVAATCGDWCSSRPPMVSHADIANAARTQQTMSNPPMPLPHF